MLFLQTVGFPTNVFRLFFACGVLGCHCQCGGPMWFCPNCPQESVIVTVFLNLIWLILGYIGPWIQPDFASNVSLEEQT